MSTEAKTEDHELKTANQAPEAAEVAETVLDFQQVKKTFRIPILHTFNPKDWREKGYRIKVEAVKDVTMVVRRGEIFGFLGPNGAGKSTTIKMLMGLIRPSSGRISLLGEPVWNVSAQAGPLGRWLQRYQPGDLLKRVGYLPEQPYFYDFLRPDELLRFFGRIHGIDKKTLNERIDYLIDLVGLAKARDRVLRKFSKGMLQRVGIASCLINDPELVILDEPLSGLDPMGRKQLRDLIVSLRKQGKTVFFSSHILHDIELICDRVAFVIDGRIAEIGTLHELQSREKPLVEVLLRGVGDDFQAALGDKAADYEQIGNNTHLMVAEAQVEAVLRLAFERKLSVISVIPRKKSLEEIFISEAKR